MANLDLPRAQGLYDPANEHDACGVAFVVDLHGRQSHDLVGQGITALCNLQHRGASGCEVNTGDGAGILLQIPDRFLRAVVDFDLPAAGAYATGIAFLPEGPGECRQGGRGNRRDRGRRRSPAPRLARRPDRRLDARQHRAVGGAVVPPDLHRWQRAQTGAGTKCGGRSDPARRPARRRAQRHRVGAPGVHRAQADRARGSGARVARARQRLLPEPLVPHDRLQGHAHDAAARGVLPRPRRRAGRECTCPRALAVLDQHVPVVAARAPVPLPGAQRRDQHAEGQPELDAGARSVARVGPLPRRPRAHLPDLHAGRLGLRLVRRGPRAARPERPVTPAFGAHDDPGGVGEPRRR